ncbi:MAG TPA: type IX secretion system protein PorQ [Flavobacteriales bacterium]|nr:type IX secretion system protein PorQ [Flavobacteriales bacterium]
MFVKRTLTVLLFTCFGLVAYGQKVANDKAEGTVFSQMQIPYGSRLAGLGGVTVAIRDRDPSIVFANPSLLDSTHHNKAVLGYSNYFADINYGVAAYSRSYKNLGHFMAALKYMNYGKFTETDYIGNELGTIHAVDYTLSLIYSRKVDTSVYIGASLNYLYSLMNKYSAMGIGVDLAATYNKPGSRFVASAILKNIGYQLKSYTPGTRGNLPFDIQLAFSQKLKHAPFRFHVAMDRLYKWDLTYKDPTEKPDIDPATGLEITKDTTKFFYRLGQFGGKAMRHITPGAEILIGKNFYVDLGFNYRRREELKYSGRTGLAGFNFGFGLFVKRMSAALSYSKYHLAGTNVQMTFSYAF